MNLLNKINQWTQDGPYGTYLQQPEWGDFDVGELVGATSLQDLMQETGFFEGWDDVELQAWEEVYGMYLTPYDPTQEKLISRSFIDTMSQKFSETYTALGTASKVGGRTGMGISYGASSITQDVLQNAGASMATARHAKNRAIYGEREDWVDGLYDMFEYLATVGAFGEE